VDRRALVTALGMAALGAACLFLYMRRFEAENGGGAKVSVVVAARDIKLGEILQQGMLGVRELPQAYVDQRHIRVADVSNVLGAPVRVSVHANEAVLWSDLASMKAERRDLSALILPGMRALTINARRESVFAGLLRPGDRVDIVFSPQGAIAAMGTSLLLQNVVVLAVGMDTGGTEQLKNANTAVTVSLTPEQAQRLIRARSEGVLDVVLRNPDDVVVIKDMPQVVTANAVPASTIPQSDDKTRRSRDWRRQPEASEAGEQRDIDRVR
jgi:pilus assembly protein CpaB